MSVDPRQPVLVGIGSCMQREDDLTRSQEPMDLMLQAVQLAARDAVGVNGAQLLKGLNQIAVPKGRWRYRNPAGEIARTIGADAASTVLASVGVLQQFLIGDACRQIAAGEIESALVVGADAGHRIACAKKRGQRATERQQEEDTPDVSLEPAEELLHPAELRAGIRMPIALYAILESAWRAKNGWTLDHHRQHLGVMYQRFSELAAGNPQAWRRQAFSAEQISEASDRNPMQAFPYTRLHCTHWNVDQSAALLLCSAGKAQALGIDPAGWIYASASTESNHMLSVSARSDLATSIGARLAGRAALEGAGLSSSQIDWMELYSCFPIAVQCHAQALGLEWRQDVTRNARRDLTVTGGMPFAGGPFNNYVLQATCRMAELIRQDSALQDKSRHGLVSSVSGVLTKHGFGVWSSQPPANGFAFKDVSLDTAQQTVAKVVLEDFHGLAVVAGYTVLHDKEQAPSALVLADTANGGRALARSSDPALIDRVQHSEFCGATIAMHGTLFSAA